jgi:hypothetical protein
MTLGFATAASLCLMVAGATHRSPPHRHAPHPRRAAELPANGRAFRQVVATVEGAYAPARPAAAAAAARPVEIARPAPGVVAPAPALGEQLASPPGALPQDPAPAAAPALEQATRIEASSYAWNDSNALSRVAGCISATTSLSRFVRLRAAGGASYLLTGGGNRAYGLGGGAITIGTGLFSVNAQGALVQQPAGITADAQLSGALAGSLGALVLKARSRPFIEAGDPLATDESVVYSAGLGGASNVAAVTGVRVSELSLSGGASPLRWLFVYVNGLAGLLSDGNRTFSGSAGVRASVCKAAGLECPVDFVFRWDGYLLSYRAQQPGYFSPALFDSQSVGGELRFMPAPPLELWASGGAVVGLLRHDPPGYFVGGGFNLSLGPFSLSLRFTVQNEQYYQSKRGWMGLGFQL